MERIAIQRSLRTVEALRREMTAAGDRLLLALAVEEDFDRFNPGEDQVDLRKQWMECRHIVGQFADDYAAAVQRWRTAVQESAGLASAHRCRHVPRVLAAVNRVRTSASAFSVSLRPKVVSHLEQHPSYREFIFAIKGQASGGNKLEILRNHLAVESVAGLRIEEY